MSRPAAEVIAEARRRGAQVHRVGPATSKAALLSDFARALEFPDWSGHNWDALADSLRDLSWLPAGPHAVVWTGSTALKEAHPARTRRRWRCCGRRRPTRPAPSAR